MPFPIIGANRMGAEVIMVRCVGAGSSNPTSVVGTDVTVARSATGTYTLTLASTSTARRKGTLVFCAASAKIVSADNLIGSASISGGVITVVFRTAAGVNTDPPSTAVVDILAVVAP